MFYLHKMKVYLSVCYKTAIYWHNYTQIRVKLMQNVLYKINNIPLQWDYFVTILSDDSNEK